MWPMRCRSCPSRSGRPDRVMEGSARSDKTCGIVSFRVPSGRASNARREGRSRKLLFARRTANYRPGLTHRGLPRVGGSLPPSSFGRGNSHRMGACPRPSAHRTFASCISDTGLDSLPRYLRESEQIIRPTPPPPGFPERVTQVPGCAGYLRPRLTWWTEWPDRLVSSTWLTLTPAPEERNIGYTSSVARFKDAPGRR
jgi:hypothetical protein